MRIARRKAVIALLVAQLVCAGADASAQAASPVVSDRAPVHLVIDTDVFSDVDDVGALATAFALQLDGEAKILAIGVDTRTDRPAVADASPRCVKAVAQFYGYPRIPIGASRPLHGSEQNPVDFITPCAALVTRPAWVPSEVVLMYRRVLARQPNHSVVVVSLGYLGNLAALLASPSDAISPMTGIDLVDAKVAKLVVMGGGYPSRNGENNFVGDPAAAAQVAAGWPGKIVWDGYEVGDQIHTGQTISQTHPADSPVRAAYEAFVGPGNWVYSYDPTAVYYAVRRYDPALTLSSRGSNTIASDGSNRFQFDPHTRQRYLLLNDRASVDASIEALLDELPPPH